MSEEKESTSKTLGKWVDLGSLLLLSLAALATSWSTYQASLWNGVQASNYSHANALRVESTRASMIAGQMSMLDVGLFTRWLDAYENHDSQLEQFYENRFRPVFKPAFDEWMQTGPMTNREAPSSPFVMQDYHLIMVDQAMKLERDADNNFKVGQSANAYSDAFTRSTVILDLCCFLARWRSRFLPTACAASWCCWRQWFARGEFILWPYCHWPHRRGAIPHGRSQIKVL